MNIRTSFDDLSREFVSAYKQYNGFYQRSDVRQIIYDLYKGKCAYTGEAIPLAEADVGHIVPQSKPELFSSLYPGLNVDNVLNLHLIRRSVNIRNSNSVVGSPLAIHNAISFSAKLVDQRLSKVLSDDPQEIKEYGWLRDECARSVTDPKCIWSGALRQLALRDALLLAVTSRQGRFAIHSSDGSAIAGSPEYCNMGFARLTSAEFLGGEMLQSNMTYAVPRTLASKLADQKFSGVIYPAKEVTEFIRDLERELDRTEDVLRGWQAEKANQTPASPRMGMPT